MHIQPGFVRWSGCIVAWALAGCAQIPAFDHPGVFSPILPLPKKSVTPSPVPPPVGPAPASTGGLHATPPAQVVLQRGITAFQQEKFDLAVSELNAALAAAELTRAERLQGYKTLAFSHCSAKRETACSEAFLKALEIDPYLTLDPLEADNPAWGTVFRNLRQGVTTSNVSTAKSVVMSRAQELIADGIRDYTNGEFADALRHFTAALKETTISPGEQIQAHKFSAFSHCVSNQVTACRADFQRLLKIDPAFELTPAEAGHPMWSRVFQQEKRRLARSAAPAR